MGNHEQSDVPSDGGKVPTLPPAPNPEKGWNGEVGSDDPNDPLIGSD